MDVGDVLIRVAAVIGVGVVASFIGYGIPALLRKLWASRHRDAGSSQASAPDNRAARG
ncbi:MAG: hypothetical protein JW990_03025 [Thermoleophilia bacterium]|nr:hypothetical protein [Thermoleophilia bacterium]